MSLGESKHLERVCIIAREGPMKIDSRVVISLFEKVYNVFLQKNIHTPPTGILFGLNSPHFWKFQFSFALFFKSSGFCNSLPLGMTFPWGGYGYFLEPLNMRLLNFGQSTVLTALNLVK